MFLNDFFGMLVCDLIFDYDVTKMPRIHSVLKIEIKNRSGK